MTNRERPLYGDKPGVPDDVIEDGERLTSVLDEFRDNAGKPLAYQRAALDALGPAVRAAIKAWGKVKPRMRNTRVVLSL